MAWVALCGPELEENLSLRYLAATLKAAGIDAHVLAASQPEDFPAVLARILRAPEPPLAVGPVAGVPVARTRFPGAGGGAARSGIRRPHHRRRSLRDLRRRRAAARFPRARLDLPAGGRGDARRARPRARRRVPLAGHSGRRRARWRRPGRASREHAGAARSRDGCPGPITRRRAGALLRSRNRAAGVQPRLLRQLHASAASPPGTSRRCPESATACASQRTSPPRWSEMQRARGIDIFVFHDDNFFIPSHAKSLARLNALADALEAQGTARLRHRGQSPPQRRGRPKCSTSWWSACNCIRCYIGVETDADQGLVTLRRWARPRKTIAPSRSRAGWSCTSASTC